MTQTQTLKDFYGRVLGYIETDDKGNQIAKDFYRRVVGRYDAKLNVTKDFYGKVVSRGNTLASLIPPLK